MLISSELEEVVEGSDTVVVLRDGAVVGTLSGAEVSQDGVLGADRRSAAGGDGVGSRTGHRGWPRQRMPSLIDPRGAERRRCRPLSSTARSAAVGRDEVLDWIAERGVYVGLLLLIAFNLVFTPRFAEIDNIRLQFVQVVPVAIIALGMALVIGTRGIDLSVGSVMAIASALLALYLGYGPAVAIIDRAGRRRVRSASSTAC